MNLNFQISCLIALLGFINLKCAGGFRCEFRDMLDVFWWRRYDFIPGKWCYIQPDSGVAEKKLLPGTNDNDITKVFVGINGSLSTSEFAFCERFKNLKQVFLRYPEHLDEDLLKKCKNLRTLFYQYGEFKNLPENLFSHNKKLDTIRMKSLELTTLPENIFINQNELEVLELSHNSLTCLAPNTFKSLKKLKKLNLSENKIDLLNPAWFENLYNLVGLDLGLNNIQDLPRNIFRHLHKLESLHFSFNRLTTIHSDSFGIHRHLKTIILFENKINAIDENIIAITELSTVDMDGNLCSGQYLYGKDEIKEKLGKCFENYEPREEQQIRCGTRLFAKQLMHFGNATKRSEYPWNVALVTTGGDLFCGGTLVSNKLVVTAAHCIQGKDDSHVFTTIDFRVLLGVHNYLKRQEEGRTTVCVKTIHINPAWNTDVQHFDGDIAVLELANDIQFNNFIRPICIANEESEVARAPKGTVVGFGKTESGHLSNIANKLEVPITNYHNCIRNSLDHKPFMTFRTFCGGPADGRGVCSGDSGGGVYVIHYSTFYLRGLVSSSLMNEHNECDVNKEAVFTDVTKYYNWIKGFGL